MLIIRVYRSLKKNNFTFIFCIFFKNRNFLNYEHDITTQLIETTIDSIYKSYHTYKHTKYY